MPRAALEMFQAQMRALEPEAGLLLVLPWASERAPEEHLADAAAWAGRGTEVVCAPAADAMAEDSVAACCQSLIAAAAGIYCTGGDQNRFMAVIARRPELRDALVARFAAGVAFAGSSAGTAIMSATMLTGEGSAPETDAAPWNYLAAGRAGVAAGLGLAPAGVVLDQHFTRRARMNRLLSVLMGAPERFGLGIDEDMAVIILGGCEVHVVATDPALHAVLIERTAGGEAPQFSVTLLPANTGRTWHLHQAP